MRKLAIVYGFPTTGKTSAYNVAKEVLEQASLARVYDSDQLLPSNTADKTAEQTYEMNKYISDFLDKMDNNIVLFTNLHDPILFDRKDLVKIWMFTLASAEDFKYRVLAKNEETGTLLDGVDADQLKNWLDQSYQFRSKIFPTQEPIRLKPEYYVSDYLSDIIDAIILEFTREGSQNG